MRQDIEFEAAGTTLRGWLYVPDGASGPSPTVVMCHGFSAVKEMYTDLFAEAFCDAGLAVILYDNRNLGASDGEPRQEIDPWAQVRDFRDAISYARARDEVDDDRIGIWGSSYSGAHAIVVGAMDRRVKCVVSQVPLISGYQNARRLVRADMIGPFQRMFEADREARFRGEAPQTVAAVAPEGEPCAMPTPDSYEWFTSTAESRAPAWRNEVTLRSVEMFWEYEPGAYLPYVSPTPLLLVIAAGDHLTVSDVAIDAFERAREPKKLQILAGGHFEAYTNDFEAASAPARDWFVQHLHARQPALA